VTEYIFSKLTSGLYRDTLYSEGFTIRLTWR